MQRMQNKGATKTEQSRWKLRNKTTVFANSYFYFGNWKITKKINFYGGATTNYKKNKGQGFTYYITKLSVLQYVSTLGWVWGFVWSCVCKLSVKNWKAIAKEKPVGINFKGNYCQKG